MHKKGSCPYGDASCIFSHDVPTNGNDIMKQWLKPHIDYIQNDNKTIEQLNANLTRNASKSNSKLQSFLVNVIKEMINKEFPMVV